MTARGYIGYHMREAPAPDDELTRVGVLRSEHWGFSNIYTYTKKLGELLMAESGLPTPLLRAKRRLDLCSPVAPATSPRKISKPASGAC